MNTKEMILVLDTETCDLSGSVYDVGLHYRRQKRQYCRHS